MQTKIILISLQNVCIVILFHMTVYVLYSISIQSAYLTDEWETSASQRFREQSEISADVIKTIFYIYLMHTINLGNYNIYLSIFKIQINLKE